MANEAAEGQAELVLDERWVELQAEDGRTYFWGRADNSRVWSLPEGTRALWVSQKTPDGRLYYWSRSTKEVTWQLPKIVNEPQRFGQSGAAAADEDSTSEEGEAAVRGAPAAGGGSAPAPGLQALEARLHQRLGGPVTGSPQPAIAPQVVSQASVSAAPVMSASLMDALNAQVKAPAVQHATSPAPAPALAAPQANKEAVNNADEQKQAEEEDEDEDEVDEAALPPGPLGDSASAVAARHMMESSPCDSWFCYVGTQGTGGWEEVVKFWPPRGKKKKPPPPSAGNQKDPFGLKPLVKRFRLHERQVRGLLAAADGNDDDYSSFRYPCPADGDQCFWTLHGKQLIVDKEKAATTISRNPAEGGRWRLLKNSLRSKLGMVFNASKLQDLEDAMERKDGERVQKLLERINDPPEALQKAAQRIIPKPEPPKQPMPANMATPPPPPQPSASPSADVLQSYENSLLSGGRPSQGSSGAQPSSAGAVPRATPGVASTASSGPSPFEIAAAEAMRGESAKASGAPLGEGVEFKPKRLDAADGAAPWRKRTRRAGLAKDPAQEKKERLARIVVVENVPAGSSAPELADFFTGAVFSVAGHADAAHWQTGAASKVVLAVDLDSAARAGEVTFGTHQGATVAMSLNGIFLRNQALTIKRPNEYEPLSDKAPPQLGTKIHLKDLVASEAAERTEKRLAAERAADSEQQKSAELLLSGVPPSMKESSVRDLLVQFGGALKTLQLEKDSKTGLHTGVGTAVFESRDSALEAVRFSPLLGFIDVCLAKGGDQSEPPQAPVTMKEAFPDASARPAGVSVKQARAAAINVDDLGPFEDALRKRSKQTATDLGPFNNVVPAKPIERDDTYAVKPIRRFREAEKSKSAASAIPVIDLGPFESVVPAAPVPKFNKPQAQSIVDDDLGPFASVVPQKRSSPQDDLGPFESVLPRKKTPASSADDDLGPFAGVVPEKRKAPQDDLGPFELVVPKRAKQSTQDDLGPFEAVVPRHKQSRGPQNDLGPFEQVLEGVRKPSRN